MLSVPLTVCGPDVLGHPLALQRGKAYAAGRASKGSRWTDRVAASSHHHDDTPASLRSHASHIQESTNQLNMPSPPSPTHSHPLAQAARPMSKAAATAAAAATRSLLLGSSSSSTSSGRRVLPPLLLLPQQRHRRVHNEAQNGAVIDVRGHLGFRGVRRGREGGSEVGQQQVGTACLLSIFRNTHTHLAAQAHDHPTDNDSTGKCRLF